MSDEEKVETAAADDKEADAIWAEIQAGRGTQGAAPRPDPADEPDKDDASPTEEAPAGEPPASREADDKWAKAPPELREDYERTRTRAEEAERLASRHSGRLSKINAELNDLRSQIASQRTGERTPQGEEATDREQRLKQLREEYPDVAGPLLDMLAEQESRVRELSEGRQAEAEVHTEELLQEQMRVVESQHPDWRDALFHTVNGRVVERPEYVEWATRQPGYIQQALIDNQNRIVDGASIAEIIAKFKADTGKGNEREKERRKEQLDGLRDPALRVPQAKPGDDDEDRIWQELQEKRRRAATG